MHRHHLYYSIPLSMGITHTRTHSSSDKSNYVQLKKDQYYYCRNNNFIHITTFIYIHEHDINKDIKFIFISYISRYSSYKLKLLDNLLVAI